MSDEQLRRLTERQNTIWKRMEEILAAADKDGWNGELRTNYDQADNDLTEVSADIERVNRSAKLANVDYSQLVETGPVGESRGEQRGGDPEAEYRDAFYSYMRSSVVPMPREKREILQRGYSNSPEQRAAAAGTGSAGGYLVPAGFRAVMMEALKAFGGILQYADIITTDTGNPLSWPTADDTGNIGAILGENTQIAEQDFTFGQATLGAYTYTSKLVRVSWQLLQDSAFDLEAWLPPKLGERIGRAWAAHLVSGTGSGQPTGLIANGTAGVTGGAGTALTITFDQLIDLEHSVDPAYRFSPRARYVLSDAALKTIRKLKDSQGQYLWQPSPAANVPPTINGHPYTVENNMAVPAANARTVAFGDFQAGFLVRVVRDITLIRLSERYADYLQDGLFSFARMDARPNDPNAVKILVQGPS